MSRRERQEFARDLAQELTREQRAERERVRAEANRVERERLRLLDEDARQVWRMLGFVVLGLLMILAVPLALWVVVR